MLKINGYNICKYETENRIPTAIAIITETEFVITAGNSKRRFDLLVLTANVVWNAWH